jgi:hypothetical protein
MAQEFKYPLTRVCLRSGSLTLPMAMLEAFPSTGAITAVDTATDTEFALEIAGRRVDGLDAFFAAHSLEVNDEVIIRPLDEGRFGFTPQKRDRRPDYSRPDVVRRFIDEVVAAVPVSEAEIRALHPDLPSEFPLRAQLEDEPRLAFFEGRWQSRSVVEAHLRAQELEQERRRDEARRRAEAAEREEALRRAEAAERAAAERAAAERAAAEREAAERAQAEREAAARRAQAERERLGQRASDDLRAVAQRDRVEREAQRELEEEQAFSTDAVERFDWDQPISRTFRLPWQRKTTKESPSETPPASDPLRLDRLGEARPAAPRPSVVPSPRAANFGQEAALNSESLAVDPAKTKRAREAFASFGYRVEGLAHGQLMLHADLGRRQYRTLLHVLPDGERLDWAALLARRRDSNAKYLAVVGDHRDLHRLTAPADLARATLWSWAGVERVSELTSSVMIGPFDLEPHFERDGMFEYGLERFERSIAKRVQERGTLSTVLTSLAGLRAPAVFVLEDLAAHGELPRDQIVRVLERLSEAPFHLVSKVDSGEFCLRYRVHDALDQLGSYATSLRARLPDRQRDRVRGLPEGVEPISMLDMPAASLDAPGGGAPSREPVRVLKAAATPAAKELRTTAPTPPATSRDTREAASAPKAAPHKGPRASKASPTTATSRMSPVAPDDAPTLVHERSVVTERRAPGAKDQQLFTGPGFVEGEADDIDLSAAATRRGRQGTKR